MLTIGGGCRALALSRELIDDGHAVRATTRSESRRAAIEAAGAECWIGDPDVIGTLRYALDGVTVLCWLLGTATGARATVAPLHGSRLQTMLSQTIDTTVRGVVYEAAGTVEPQLLRSGAAIVAATASRSAIPYTLLEADPRDRDAWLAVAHAALGALV